MKLQPSTIFGISVCFALLILTTPRLVSYYIDSQPEVEKLYTSIGVATIRIMDPEQRVGIEIPHVYALKDE